MRIPAPDPDGEPVARVHRPEEPDAVVPFSFAERGRRALGIVVVSGGEVTVFRNRCPHWSVPLDHVGGRWWTADGARLECSVHAAEFDPADGRCTAGPCEGASLLSLPFRLEDDVVVILRPRWLPAPR